MEKMRRVRLVALAVIATAFLAPSPALADDVCPACADSSVCGGIHWMDWDAACHAAGGTNCFAVSPCGGGGCGSAQVQCLVR